MGSLMKMLAYHCILLVAILLSTYSPATGQNNSPNEGENATKPTKSVEEYTTFPEMSSDLPSTTEAILPENATTVTTSAESSSTMEVPVITTKKPSTISVTTKGKTTAGAVSTSKIATTTKIHETSKNPSTKSPTESQPQGTTKKHVTSDEPTREPTNLLTIKQKDSSETSSKENGSTKDSPTDSSFLGVDKNSFTAKVILPIAAGIILAVFIVLIVCSIRSCLDRKERKSSRRTMDHDMAPMDRVMLLADSSEDEF